MPDATLSCLLLPLGEKYWLIPSVVGAEIVSEPWVREAQQETLLSYEWREQTIPLINSEWLLEQHQSSTPHRRVCVLNSLNKKSKAPFWGLELSGLPLFVQLKQEAINPLPESNLPKYIQAKVQLSDQKIAYVPKLEELELLF